METGSSYNGILDVTYNAEVFGGAGIVSAAILIGVDNAEQLVGNLAIVGACYGLGLYSKVIGKKLVDMDYRFDSKALESKVDSDKKEY